MKVQRRQFQFAAAATSACFMGGRWAGAAAADDQIVGPLETFVPTRTVTNGPKYHWFGYYDKREFDSSGTKVLAGEVEFEGRSPVADDSIGVGYVDTADADRWDEIGRSSAWGWQQGCMLQWVGQTDRTVLWNDQDGDRFVCRLHDTKTGQTRTIDRPIY